MSIIEQQKELEYYPDEVLAQEMMQPTGIAPSFLVATEIKRRNDMRNSYQSQMNPQPQTSVVEEEAMELGGIANADPNAMQQQMMQQPMPQQQMPQGAPMQMRGGGNIRYQGGRQMTQDELMDRLFNRERRMKKFPHLFNPDGSQKAPTELRESGYYAPDEYLFGELYDQSMPRNEQGQIVQRRLGLEESGLPEDKYRDFSRIADEQLANDKIEESNVIDVDANDGFLAAGLTGPMGNKILGEGGWLYDPSSAIDNILLAGSAIPIGGRAITGAGLLGKAGIKAAVKGGKALKGKIAEGIGSIAGKRGFVPNYGGKTSIPLSEVGSQATKAFTNPFPLSLSSPFWSKTAPIGAGATFIGTRGGEDSGIGTESDASIIEAVNAADAGVDSRLEGKTLDEMAKILGDDNRQRQALTDKLAADKAADKAERDRRAALPDSARMLEDAMANVPENETFQDYLSTLEGMEESRKGQVLMDLGAAIANASHGGDIAKGFQEAGTRARAEKIEAAKERARVLGESRAMDIDVAIKMATIEADLEKQTGRTLQELLALLQMDEDFITDNYPESADAIMEQIRAAIEVSLPQATEQATE